MKVLRALRGIIRHEILLQLKTKLFAMSLINSVVVVLLWGYLAGLQAQPMHHLRVAVVEGALEAEILLASEHLVAVPFASVQLAVAAVRAGEVMAAVYRPMQATSLRVTVDDTQGAAARAVLASISSALVRGMRSNGQPDVQAPLIPLLDVEEAWGLGMDDPGYLLRLLGAAIVAMVVLSNAFVFSGFTLIAEKTSGTIHFLALAPISRIWMIVGKLIANTALIATSAVIAVTMAILLFGVSPNGSLTVLFLATLLTGLGLMGLCYAISAYVRDERTFRIVAGLPLMMPMMFLSGIMYPVAVFPDWLQVVSRAMPLNWLMRIAHEVFFKGGGLTDVWPLILLLAAFAATMVAWGTVAVSRLMRVG